MKILTPIGIVFLCLCCKPKHDTSEVTTKSGADSTSHTISTSTKNDSIEFSDSRVNTKNLLKYFKTWCEYQKDLYPNLNLDNFNKVSESKFELEETAFNYTPNFDSVYHKYLSYSPDGSKIIDLFSSQIELEKLNNGKFGGLYTLQVQPHLILPKSHKKFILRLYSSTDLFHDCYWLSEDLVMLIGSAKINIPNDYSRMYRLWIVDLKRKTNVVYDNDSIGKNIDIDSYVLLSKFKGAQVYLDEE